MDSKRRLDLINMRTHRGWIQKDVVEKLKEQFGIDISESYYGMIEQGVRTPKLQIAIAISRLFGVDVSDIFFNHEHNKTLCKRSTTKEVV